MTNDKKLKSSSATHSSRTGLLSSLGLSCFVLLSSLGLSCLAVSPPNIVIFTVDDMDIESVGAYGCPLPDITPNIDALASEGVRFENAYVATAVCQPSRQAMMTGQHPHHNGTYGFVPLPADADTLSKHLKTGGYFTANLGKGRDYSPIEAHDWDYFVHWLQGYNRKPSHFKEQVLKTIGLAQKAGKPFYINVNTSDPHRPFIGSEQEADLDKKMHFWDKAWLSKTPKGEDNPKMEDYYIRFGYERCYDPEEIPLPSYLPDLPEIRLEVAEYFSSVKRGDETLGKIVDLLKANGLWDNTIFIFISDNGASLPTAKGDCFVQSTHVPLIIRWPGITKPGSVKADGFISAMDIMPTLLDGLGLPPANDLDGLSVFQCLENDQPLPRDHVLTSYNFKSLTEKNTQLYPMRAITSKNFHYMYCPWADGTMAKIKQEANQGRSFPAIQKAAKTNPEMEAWIQAYTLRKEELLFDLTTDPYCRNDVSNDERYGATLRKMRALAEKEMEASSDPMLKVFHEDETWQECFDAISKLPLMQ